MNAQRRTLSGAAVAITLALVLAGCGSSDSSGSSSDSGGTGPIKLLTYGDYTIGGIALGRSGAQARIAEINAKGGIDGRKIELTVCDSKLDPNLLTTCLRSAIKDGVIAAVGGNSTLDGVSAPVITQANLPQIGFNPSSTAGINTPNTLCIAPAGINSTAQGFADSLKRQGATKVSFILPSGLDVSKQALPAFQAQTTKLGMQFAQAVPVPVTISDYTPAIAKATSNGADGVAAFGAGPAFVGAIRQMAGTPGLKYSVLGVGINPQVTSALGDLTGEVPVLDYVKPVTADIPGAQLFKSDMETYEPTDKNYGTQAILDWLGVYAFEQIAKVVDGPLTSESIAKAMFTIPKLDTGGFTPTLDTTKANVDNLGACVVNDAVALNKIVAGQLLEAQPGFVDAATNADVK